jgi:hypothetical protein
MDQYSIIYPSISGKEPSPRSSTVSLELHHRRTPFSSDILVLGGWCRGECNEAVVDKYFMDAYLLTVEMEERALQLGEHKIVLRWIELEMRGDIPSDRLGYSASFCRQNLIIFGGGQYWTNGVIFNDVYTLDTSHWTWKAERPTGTPPSPRQVGINRPDLHETK